MPPVLANLKEEPSLRQSLRRSLVDASFFSLMVGFGETYLAAFLLSLGFGQIASGLVTVFPVVLGSLLQLAVSFQFRHVKNFRLWVVLCAKIQALTLFMLALSPIGIYLNDGNLPQHMLPGIFILAAIYWAAGFSAGPAWNAWMGALVPPSLRIAFFSRRTRVAQVFILLGVIAGGFLLHYAPHWLSRSDSGIPYGTPLRVHQVMIFSFLLLAAGFSRLGSAFFISRQRDEKSQRIDPLFKRSFSFLKNLKEKNIGVLLSYMFFLQVSVYIAAPFFSPFMLKQLQLNYIEYMLLTSVTFLTRIALFPLFSRFADKKGPVPLVAIGTCLVAATPFLWTMSDQIWFLIFIQMISGAGWGLQEMGVFFLLLDRYPSAERSNVLTTVNVLGSIGMLLGSLIGTLLLKNLGTSMDTYYALFTVSTVARVATALILPYMDHKPGERHYALVFRVIGLRPNMGAIVRPILYLKRRKQK